MDQKIVGTMSIAVQMCTRTLDHLHVGFGQKQRIMINPDGMQIGIQPNILLINQQVKIHSNNWFHNAEKTSVFLPKAETAPSQGPYIRSAAIKFLVTRN